MQFKYRVLFLLLICVFGLSIDCFASPLLATKILIQKSERKLLLLHDKDILKTYKIALGPNPIGPKMEQGDGKTPEGKYRIDYRNPKSSYHLSLHVSYPNQQDRERAKKLKVDPGGDIMIHGVGKYFGWLDSLQHMTDWTAGCIAVKNEEIEEIWRLVSDGTEVEIRP